MDPLALALERNAAALAKARAAREAKPKYRGALDERTIRTLAREERHAARAFDREHAARLYAEGLSLAGIGFRFGVSKGAVARGLRSIGVTIKSNGLGPHAIREAAE